MTPFFDDGRGRSIFHGDAFDLLSSIPHHVVISDPPYGCAATSVRGGKYSGFRIEGDETPACRDRLVGLMHVPWILFGSPKVPRPPCRAVLIWAKGDHTGMGDLSFPWKPDFDEIYVSGQGWAGDRTTGVLRHDARTDSGRTHPTEKPVSLMADLIRKAPPGVILDPFMGSGSTLVAAKEMARNAVGIEIEERYCEIAARRLQQEVFAWE